MPNNSLAVVLPSMGLAYEVGNVNREADFAHSPHGSESCRVPGYQPFYYVSNTWAQMVDRCGLDKSFDDCPVFPFAQLAR